jgi:hypothetical protein
MARGTRVARSSVALVVACGAASVIGVGAPRAVLGAESTSVEAAAPTAPLRACFLEDDAPRAHRESGRGFDLAVMQAVASDAGTTLAPVWGPLAVGLLRGRAQRSAAVTGRAR